MSRFCRSSLVNLGVREAGAGTCSLQQAALRVPRAAWDLRVPHGFPSGRKRCCRCSWFLQEKIAAFKRKGKRNKRSCVVSHRGDMAGRNWMCTRTALSLCAHVWLSLVQVLLAKYWLMKEVLGSGTVLWWNTREIWGINLLFRQFPAWADGGGPAPASGGCYQGLSLAEQPGDALSHLSRYLAYSMQVPSLVFENWR